MNFSHANQNPGLKLGFPCWKLARRRNVFQCLAHSLSTDMRKAVFFKLNYKELREEGGCEMKTQQWRRSYWFSKFFPLCFLLSHIFAHVSPQSALRCSPESFLPNGKLSLTFLKLTFPSYCSPACHPWRTAWEVILYFSWWIVSVAGLWLQSLMQKVSQLEGQSTKGLLEKWKFKTSRSLFFREVQTDAN